VPAIRRASQSRCSPDLFAKPAFAARCGGQSWSIAVTRAASACSAWRKRVPAPSNCSKQAGSDLKADRTAWFGTRCVGMRTHDDGAAPIPKRHVQEDIGAEILDACDDAIESSIPDAAIPTASGRNARCVVLP